MNDCLIHQLKGTVDNDNLETFGKVTLKFKANTPATAKYSRIACPANETLEVKALNHNFIDGNGADTGSNTMVCSNATGLVHLFYVSGLGDTVEIDKYNIVELDNSRNVEGLEKPIDIETFKYCEHLEILRIRGCKGDIGSMASVTTLRSFRAIAYEGVIKLSDALRLTQLTELGILNANDGTTDNTTLADFGVLTNLTDFALFWIPGFKGGTVESFVAAQVRAGRTTCSQFNAHFFCVDPNQGGINVITFNGQGCPNAPKTLSWQPNATEGRTDVTFDGTTVTVDNATGNIIS